MQNVFDAADDIDVLESMREVAKQFRRKRSAGAAITAAKVELLFSKAIEDISAKQPQTEGVE